MHKTYMESQIITTNNPKKIENMEEECTTPRNQECRLQAPVECPPAPKKKRECRKREIPKNGYFRPSDLDSILDNVTASTR